MSPRCLSSNDVIRSANPINKRQRQHDGFSSGARDDNGGGWCEWSDVSAPATHQAPSSLSQPIVVTLSVSINATLDSHCDQADRSCAEPGWVCEGPAEHFMSFWHSLRLHVGAPCRADARDVCRCPPGAPCRAGGCRASGCGLGSSWVTHV